MGLFGGAATTKTTVKPSKQVDEILRSVVSDTMNQPLQEYISHQVAQMSPEQQQAVNAYAQSGALKQASALLSPRLTQGLDQMTANNRALQSVIDKPITANEALSQGNVLRNGLYSQVQQQAQSANNVAGRLGSPAARAAQRRGASQMQAMSAINPNSTNTAINLLGANQKNQLNILNDQSNLAAFNQGLGTQGVHLSNQALQNQVNAGTFQQSYQNNINQNAYQNANSAALFPWEQIKNNLNVLNQVSPMAGYTTTGTTAAAPVAQQMAGAGLTGLSIYGKLGGFQSADALKSGEVGGTGANAPVYANQWSNSGNTGLWNKATSWMGSSSNQGGA